MGKEITITITCGDGVFETYTRLVGGEWFDSTDTLVGFDRDIRIHGFDYFVREPYAHTFGEVLD